MSTLTPLKQDRSVFFDPSALPWTPWAMPGTWFKLLNIDETSGRSTFILKVDAGVTAPIHKHLGAAEAFILEGEFGYDDDRGGVGTYVNESSGALHTPDSPKGVIMLAIMHGPILGFNEDGSIAGVIDWEWLYDAAKDNNAAAHIVIHAKFTPVAPRERA